LEEGDSGMPSTLFAIVIGMIMLLGSLLSTAVMFAVMSPLVANRLRSQLRYIDKAVVIEESWRRPRSERRREDMSLSRSCK
jgi:hypothetical protein